MLLTQTAMKSTAVTERRKRKGRGCNHCPSHAADTWGETRIGPFTLGSKARSESSAFATTR